MDCSPTTGWVPGRLFRSITSEDLMRVLHVNHSLDPVTGGGTAGRTASLCRALSRLGVRMSVLTLDLGLDHHVRAGLGTTQVIPLRCLNRRFYIPEPAHDLIRSAVTVADVVHLSGHWTALNALAYRAARLSGTPHVMTPAGALRVFGRSAGLKRAYTSIVGRRIVSNAAAHIAITGTERHDFAAYGVSPAAVPVVPNGVWAEDFTVPGESAFGELNARLGGDTRPFALFMGRLNPIKGPDLLLSAVATLGDRLGDVRVVLAGPDEGMGPALQAHADAAGLHDRVTFLGPVEGEVKVAAYRMARLLVVPSRREAMSLVALEAGASGTPVLLTDACGFSEVESAGGGLVVPTTVEGLAGGLMELLSEPAHLAEKGRRLQHLVLADYTWERAARSHLCVYHHVVDARAKPSPRPGDEV